MADRAATRKMSGCRRQPPPVERFRCIYGQSIGAHCRAHGQIQKQRRYLPMAGAGADIEEADPGSKQYYDRQTYGADENMFQPHLYRLVRYPFCPIFFAGSSTGRVCPRMALVSGHYCKAFRYRAILWISAFGSISKAGIFTPGFIKSGRAMKSAIASSVFGRTPAPIALRDPT